MPATKLRETGRVTGLRAELENTLATELPFLSASVRCAAEHIDIIADREEVELHVPTHAGDSEAMFRIPRLLVTARAPKLYARHVVPPRKSEDPHTCDSSKTTVPAVQILVYWLFTGRMPEALRGPRLRDAKVEKGAVVASESALEVPEDASTVVSEPQVNDSTQQTSLLRLWHEVANTVTA